jgi:hypothetical protein
METKILKNLEKQLEALHNHIIKELNEEIVDWKAEISIMISVQGELISQLQQVAEEIDVDLLEVDDSTEPEDRPVLDEFERPW